MPIDSTGGPYKQQTVQPNEQVQETEELAKLKQKIENEKIMQSSIGKAEEQKILQNLEPSNPQLKSPNPEILAQNSDAGGELKNVYSNEEIAKALQAFPQLQTLLDSQKSLSINDIVKYAVEEIERKTPNTLSLNALAGKALEDKISEALAMNKSPALEKALSDVKTDLLFENHPLAKILTASLKNDLIAQGKSPDEAEQMAKQQAAGMIESKFGGDITSDNPKIDNTIATLLAAQLGSVDAAKKFIASLSGLVNMQGQLSSIFDTLSKVNSGQKVDDKSIQANQNMIKSAQQIVDEATTLINKLPLPENQKNSILAFMKNILAALALLKKLVSEISMADLQWSKAQFSSKVEQIMSQLKTQLDEIKKAMEKIRKAKKKAHKFGILGKIMKILNKVLSAVMIAVILVLMVAMLLMMPVLAPVAIVGMIALGAMLVFAVTSLGLSQTGQLDKLMDSIFNVAYMAMHDVLGIHVSKQVAALIMGGVLVGLLAIPLLLTAVLLPLLIVLAPLLIMMLPFVGALLVLGAAALLLITMVVGVVAVPLIFGFLPEMIVRSGILGTIAAKIGSKLGMSEDEINTLNAALRGAVGMLSLSVGMNVSSSFGKLSEGDQKLVDEEAEKKGDMDADKRKAARLGGYRNLGHVTTLNELATKKATSPEETEKKQKELMEMIALLRKIIDQLKKLLATLLSGGGPQAVSSAIQSIQDLIDKNMKQFTTSSGQVVDIKSLASLTTETTLPNVPNVLPSEDAIKEMLKKARNQEIFAEDDKEQVRTQELMG